MKILTIRAVVSCLVVFGLCAQAQAADSITLGFPEFDKGLNVLVSSHPAAAFIRRAVLARLAESPTEGALRLTLSDSISSSADRRRWSFRISPLARFSDSRPVAGTDVEYSLMRCVDSGILHGVDKIESEAVVNIGRTSQWVHVEFGSPVDVRTAGFALELSRCPILERHSSTLFGKDLGEGTNLISAGEYAFADFKAGREIILKRQKQGLSQAAAVGADTISIRSFKDSSAALAALRAGTIDAFLSEEAPVIERAKKDETLLALQCPIYTVILRKGLKLPCPDTVIASEIRYLS